MLEECLTISTCCLPVCDLLQESKLTPTSQAVPCELLRLAAQGDLWCGGDPHGLCYGKEGQGLPDITAQL